MSNSPKKDDITTSSKRIRNHFPTGELDELSTFKLLAYFLKIKFFKILFSLPLLNLQFEKVD